jgi:hypothetical protein
MWGTVFWIFDRRHVSLGEMAAIEWRNPVEKGGWEEKM